MSIAQDEALSKSPPIDARNTIATIVSNTRMVPSRQTLEHN